MFDSFVRQKVGASSKVVSNLLILRMLAQPLSPTLWCIGQGAGGWVASFTNHWTVRGSRKWLYFQVPCEISSMLLPDMYRELVLPKTLPAVCETESRVRRSIRWDLSDESEVWSEPTKDVLDNWETIRRDQISPETFREEYEGQWSIDDLRTKPRSRGLLLEDPSMESVRGSLLLEPRLSDSALGMLWMYPDEVMRTCYMCEGTMRPLYRYEAAVIQTVCRGRATLTVRGE